MTERSLLVVEDDEDLANVVALNLRGAGHRVTLEHNGRSALEKAQTEGFDLIVLDLTLPGMDRLGSAIVMKIPDLLAVALAQTQLWAKERPYGFSRWRGKNGTS